MNCPKCKNILSDRISSKINFCPICGEKLFEEGTEYLIEVTSQGQSAIDNTSMMLFVDETSFYEMKPGEKVYFKAKGGFHTLKFRYKIRNKSIQILVNHDFSIKAYFNTISGLIETSVNELDEKNREKSFGKVDISKPVMVSKDGQRGFDIMLGEDEPEFELVVTSGLKEGVLKIFAERCEFKCEKDMKKEVVQYKDVVEVKKKMGSVDIVCGGNVHKVYSIPKENYNEVMAFLTNRVAEVNTR